MPIRINLLAEAKAIEEMRQRDPVKRVILAGILVIGLILVYSSSLWAKTIMARGDVNRLEQEVAARKTQYKQILENQKDLVNGQMKLNALHRYSTNRFLVGSLLQALSQSTSKNVQLTSLQLRHSYLRTAEIKPKSGERGKARAATSTEKIVLTLNAKDSSPNPGDGVHPFKDTLLNSTYFSDLLGQTNEFRLMSLGVPQTDLAGQTYLQFSVEAKFPEKIR